MILVDQPYVSNFFKKTAREHHLPIVKTAEARSLGFTEGFRLVVETEAIARLRAEEAPRIYTTSENAIGWIARHLSETILPDMINLFKNKVTFRRLLQPMMPDLFFQELRAEELATLSLRDLPFPFILKPAVGFFSMGVHVVGSPEEWEGVRKAVEAELRKVRDLYPREVLDTASFIIEENIEGNEFAVDAYFDAKGDPVIVGIFRHLFGSKKDVGDRVYYTSKVVVEANLALFTRFLKKVGNLTGARNFPVHVEIRKDKKGKVLPIEINPMRFGGWCTTAEMTARAYGFNPYLLYFRQARPDWKAALQGKEGKRYSIIVLDNATGIDGRRIAAFDYEGLVSRFANPLELRKIDYRTYPVFGFLFTETSDENADELDWALRMDLREFVSLDKGE